jgi:hypothetical protein
MAGPDSAIGCCSSWNMCTQVGYCVHINPQKALQRCVLGNKVFINQDEHATQVHKANAERTDVSLRERRFANFEISPSQEAKATEVATSMRRRRLTNVKVTTTEKTQTTIPKTQSSYVTTYKGIKVTLVEGKIVMQGLKIVETGETYELVSWTQKDLVHYGLREKGQPHILETVSPDKKLKGWALRKHCIGLLHHYNEQGMPDEKKLKMTLTKHVKDITEKHVLAYHNAIKEEDVYCKIISITPYLFNYINNRGEKFCFEKESLQNRLDRNEVWVINEADVPAEAF